MLKFFNIIGNCVRSFFGFKKIYYSIPHLGIVNSSITLPTDETLDPDDIIYAIHLKVKERIGIIITSEQIELL